MVSLLLTFALAGLTGVFAAFPQVGTQEPVRLSVTAKSGTDLISGLRLTLFWAGDMQVTEGGDVRFTLSPAFASYGNTIEMNLGAKMDSSAWARGAKSAESHVLSDSANGSKSFETLSAVTNEEGIAVFNGVRQGLYLMTGRYEGKAFASVEVAPVFLTLPQWSENRGEWIYDAVVGAKAEATPIPETPETPKKTSVTVRKAWLGDDAAGTSSRRPASVKVALVNGSGTKVDEKVLSAENGWTFTWTGLNQDNWMVKEEEVPSGYSVSTEEETTADGKNVTITNTTPPNEVLGESREKTPESEAKKKKKTTKGSTRQTTNADVASVSRLPQTGQLWWPVWVLAGAAAVLVILGIILRMSGKRDLKD